MVAHQTTNHAIVGMTHPHTPLLWVHRSEKLPYNIQIVASTSQTLESESRDRMGLELHVMLLASRDYREDRLWLRTAANL